MTARSLRKQLSIRLREVRYGLRHDWRKMGPFIKRTLAATVVAAVYMVSYNLPIGRRLEGALLRQWFFIRGNRDTPKSVAVVRIDELAYKKVNLLPGEKFPRQLVAQGLERMTAAGAKLIVLDLFARRPGDSNETDAQLATALANSPSVIGRFTEDIVNTDLSGRQTVSRIANKPLDIFAKSAKAVVTLQVLPTDGVVEEICLSNDEYVVSSERVPLLKPLRQFVDSRIEKPGGNDFINYYGGPFSLANLSFAELLGPQEDVPAEYFKDRIVFVGVAALAGVGIAAGKDTFMTTISSLPMYGVEIQATIAANLIDGSWIRRFSKPAEMVALQVLAFATVSAVLSFGLVSGALLTFAVAGAWLSASYLAFTEAYYFVPGATLFGLVMPIFLALRWSIRGYFAKSD